MRLRTTNRVHITSLSYRETIARQTAKKNCECASVRMNNYYRFAFVALLTKKFLRNSTNRNETSMQLEKVFCVLLFFLLSNPFPIVQIQ